MTLIFKRKLADLLPANLVDGYADLCVTGITQDSRQVRPGDLFCARSGGQFRGADFVEQAVARGAVAVLLDEAEAVVGTTVPVIRVPDLAKQLSAIAGRFYGEPSSQLTIVGITGTNGKTSCSHFIAQALNGLGIRTAVIGTVGNGFPDALRDASHTTPDAVGLQALLAELLAEGAQAVVMEVSSHALDQYRVEGVRFNVAAFTNLSRDHLDYHGTMASYGAAKSRLFSDLQPDAVVINHDDAYAHELLSCCVARKVLTFSTCSGSEVDIYAANIQLNPQGISAQLHARWGTAELNTAIVGRFNLSNLLLTYGVLHALDLNPGAIESQMNGLTPVPGRMQCLGGTNAPLVIVDYAHTPDALENALDAARQHTRQALVCVFGCGGDRDTGKRAEMGKVASQLADRILVTSDNPRTEDPEQIIQMIVEGCDHAERCDAEVDRQRAITAAISEAKMGDVVLVAGKGHENYQEVMGQKMPFDDVQVVTRALEEWQP